MKRIHLLLALLAPWLLSYCSWSQPSSEVVAVGFNVEAGYKPGAELSTVTALMLQAPKADLYVLSELSLSWAEPLATAAGGYRFLVSADAVETTDALGILYDPERFELLLQDEVKFGLHQYERPALVAHLNDRSTGRSFIVMANHLMRGQSELRQQQALILSEWAAKQTLPVLALGDYNFDFDVESQKGNRAFELFMATEQWQWIKPKNLVKTNCDEHYNSILDFVFVHGSYQKASSQVLFPESFYCSEEKLRPDHRPVLARIEF